MGDLLAYLVYHRRHMHAREVLVEAFWPESEPEAGRANLSVALSSLRHQFEPPEGRARWTVRLLADQVVQLGLLDQIHHTTIWERMKKTRSSPGR